MMCDFLAGLFATEGADHIDRFFRLLLDGNFTYPPRVRFVAIENKKFRVRLGPLGTTIL